MKRYNHQDFLDKDKLEVSSFLIYNEKYRLLSNDAKMMYQYLLKRFSLTEHKLLEAMENEELAEFTFIDEAEDLFCICSNDELCFTLGITEKTVIKCKKALVNVGLIEEQQQGLRMPNRLYVNKIIAENMDKKTFQTELKKYREVEALKRKNRKLKSQNQRQNLQSINAQNSGLENLQSLGLENFQSSTKENISTKELKDVIKIVNKEIPDSSEKRDKLQNDFDEFNKTFEKKATLLKLCNDYYSEFAPGRWSKKQWQTLIKTFADELLEQTPNGGCKLDEIKNIKAYIKSSLANMAHKFDFKTARISLNGDDEQFYIDQMSIMFLMSILPKGFIPPEEWLDLIIALETEYEMHPDAINVLIDYVLSYTNGYFPTDFVEKIVGTWQRLRITTAKQALAWIHDPNNLNRGNLHRDFQR